MTFIVHFEFLPRSMFEWVRARIYLEFWKQQTRIIKTISRCEESVFWKQKS